MDGLPAEWQDGRGYGQEESNFILALVPGRTEPVPILDLYDYDPEDFAAGPYPDDAVIAVKRAILLVPDMIAALKESAEALEIASEVLWRDGTNPHARRVDSALESLSEVLKKLSPELAVRPAPIEPGDTLQIFGTEP